MTGDSGANTISPEIVLLAGQFETLVAAITERECARGAMISADTPAPRWLRKLAILAVDIEFLVSRRDVVDLAAVADVCGEVERLLARESEDDEVRSCLGKAIESSTLVRAIAGVAERQSRRVSEIARLLDRASISGGEAYASGEDRGNARPNERTMTTKGES